MFNNSSFVSFIFWRGFWTTFSPPPHLGLNWVQVALGCTKRSCHRYYILGRRRADDDSGQCHQSQLSFPLDIGFWIKHRSLKVESASGTSSLSKTWLNMHKKKAKKRRIVRWWRKDWLMMEAREQNRSIVVTATSPVSGKTANWQLFHRAVISGIVSSYLPPHCCFQSKFIMILFARIAKEQTWTDPLNLKIEQHFHIKEEKS